MSDDKLPIFEVHLGRLDPIYVSADTHGQAKAAGFREVKEAYTEASWHDFMDLKPRARRCAENPHPDCYATVARQYGIEVEVGDRVTINAPGSTFDGVAATVRYPGPSTAHVHVRADGASRDIKLHPTEVMLAHEPAPASP